MGTKIAIIIAIIVYTLFLISVFAPVNSQKKFWVIIYKIRAVMDVISYWFYNLCGIATVFYIVFIAINSLIKG